MAGAPILSVQTFMAMGKETTRGTSIAGTIFIPIAPNPTLTPNMTWLPDDALRGSPVQTYNNIPGVRYDSYDFKGNVFSDTFPNLMVAILGGTDTVTSTVAPYLHTIKLLNNVPSGSQPPSYSIYDVDQITEGSDTAKEMVGSQAVNVDLDFSATGALNYTTKFIGSPYLEATAPTATWSTELFIPAWSSTATWSAETAPVIDGKLSINRKTSSVFMINQQGPYANYAGAIQVTGSLTILAQPSDVTLVDGLTYEKQTVSLQFTDPQSSHFVKFVMDQVQFKDPKVERSKEYITITTNFEAESNTTDASTGYSPMIFSASNAQVAPY